MNSKNIVIILLAVAVGGWVAYNYYTKPVEVVEKPIQKVTFSPLSATYSIEGDLVMLVNGKSEQEEAPGSAIKIETTVFGEPAMGDLDGDGAQDAALILVYNPGGSGTFYYVVTALQNSESGEATGTNAVLLGDRIAPQNISIENGVVLVNYADRALDEPMSAQPSIGVSKWLAVENGVLSEIDPMGEVIE